jgi:glycosyltransferase involved in cell wall biosynthesis
MGNYPPYHKRIYEMLLRRPGIVVLHDLVLRDFFRGYFIGEKRAPLVLARLIAYGGGPEGAELARAFLMGRHIDGPDDPTRLQFPMFQAALHRCLGVVVHSKYSRARVAAACPAPVEMLDFPLFGPAAEHARDKWPRPRRPGKLRLATFGVLNSNKLIHATIESFGASSYLRDNAEFTVVGAGDVRYTHRLRKLIEQHGLGGVVHLVGRHTDAALQELITETDVVVNLRNPHTGESSASLLDALTAGAATVVWNHGFYAEFPDDVVCKISSEKELTGALERLCQDAELREALRNNARRHALERFNTAKFCVQLQAFLDKVRSAQPMLALADLLSDRLAEFGAQCPDGLVERLASEISLLAS